MVRPLTLIVARKAERSGNRRRGFLGTGPRRATALPRRVIVTDRPLSAAFTRSLSRRRASLMLMVSTARSFRCTLGVYTRPQDRSTPNSGALPHFMGVSKPGNRAAEGPLPLPRRGCKLCGAARGAAADGPGRRLMADG